MNVTDNNSCSFRELNPDSPSVQPKSRPRYPAFSRLLRDWGYR